MLGPPKHHTASRIVENYSRVCDLWYFRVNSLCGCVDRGLFLDCFLRVDTSDPTEVVFHNSIKMLHTIQDPDVKNLQDLIHDSTRSTGWALVDHTPYNHNVKVYQMDVFESPWSFAKRVKRCWRPYIGRSQRQNLNLKRLKVTPALLLNVALILRSLQGGPLAYVSTAQMMQVLRIHPNQNTRSIQPLLLDVAPRDAVEHLSMIKSVRFSWE